MKPGYLKNRRGASMLMVVILMMLLFAIGTSLLVASSNAVSAGIQHKNLIICASAARDFMQYLSSEITDGIDTIAVTPSQWRAIPEEIYKAHLSVDPVSGLPISPHEAAITDATLSVSSADDRLSNLIQSIEVTLVDQSSVVKRAYIPPINDIPESPEETEVRATMDIKVAFAVVDQSYQITARYEFYGIFSGLPNEGRMESGGWKVVSYS